MACADDAMQEEEGASAGPASVSASRLSRLFFAVGQFAIQHLVSIGCVVMSTGHSWLHPYIPS